MCITLSSTLIFVHTSQNLQGKRSLETEVSLNQRMSTLYVINECKTELFQIRLHIIHEPFSSIHVSSSNTFFFIFREYISKISTRERKKAKNMLVNNCLHLSHCYFVVVFFSIISML